MNRTAKQTEIMGLYAWEPEFMAELFAEMGLDALTDKALAHLLTLQRSYARREGKEPTQCTPKLNSSDHAAAHRSSLNSLYAAIGKAPTSTEATTHTCA